MCSPFDPTCFVLAGFASGFDGIALSAGEAAAQTIAQAMTFWINTPSINPDSAVVRQLQAYTLPVVATMLVASVLVQAIRMTLSRKKDPAINVAVGLLRFAGINAIGLTTLGLALRAGDALAESMINQGIADYAERMSGLFAGIAVGNSFLLLVLAGVGLILGLIQWLIAILRMAGLLVLAAMLLLAASGAINDSTRDWNPKLWSWIVALVVYKPVAALIYVTGFGLMGAGQDFTTAATGLAVLLLSIVALPVLMRFFSWSGASVSGGAGVGGVIAAGALGALSLAKLRAGGGAPGGGQNRESSGPGSSQAGLQANPGGVVGGVIAAGQFVQSMHQAGQAAAGAMANPPPPPPRQQPPREPEGAAP